MPHLGQRTTRAALFSGLALAGTTPAAAQTAEDYQALRRKVEELQQQLDAVQRALDATRPPAQPTPVAAAAPAPATRPSSQDPLPRPAGTLRSQPKGVRPACPRAMASA
ncbi:hypothetical protein GCM10020258_37480 [Sphingomonas yabuuchiae]